MSGNSSKTGFKGAALFGIAFGAGILGGAVLSVILLEVREHLLRSAATRKRSLPDFLFDVASDFTTLTDDLVNGIASIRRQNGAEERTVQDLKTRIRHGGNLNATEETMEMTDLYGEQPVEDAE